MRKLFYLAMWFLKARFLQRRTPLQTVIFITDACNLACKHCTAYNKQQPVSKSYQQIGEELRYSYQQGSRFVDITGGEPTLWRDGAHDINSLVSLAKAIGFFSVAVTTNAAQSLAGLTADSLWVSLDGVGDYHDDIRGAGMFARALENIAASGHPRLAVNMVINSRNYPSVAQTVRLARDNPHIRMISLNFHTPHAGTEELFLDWPLRARVIDEIVAFKKSGYPVMNSVHGLSLMKDNRFAKQCWISNFILADGSRLEICPGREEGLCERCGYAMSGEMAAVLALSPETILSALKVRVGL